MLTVLCVVDRDFIRMLETTTLGAVAPSHVTERVHAALLAPTSPAQERSKPQLAYLNVSSQLYELKLSASFPGSYRSVLSLHFAEKRYDNMHQQLLQSWLAAHPGEDMIELGLVGTKGEKIKRII